MKAYFIIAEDSFSSKSEVSICESTYDLFLFTLHFIKTFLFDISHCFKCRLEGYCRCLILSFCSALKIVFVILNKLRRCDHYSPCSFFYFCTDFRAPIASFTKFVKHLFQKSQLSAIINVAASCMFPAISRSCA